MTTIADVRVGQPELPLAPILGTVPDLRVRREYTRDQVDGGRLAFLAVSGDSDAFEHGFTTSEDGTGFGLSIVETICRAHDWDIVLTPGEGGARFEVTGVGPAEHSYPLTEELIGVIVAGRRIRSATVLRSRGPGQRSYE